MAKEIEYSFLEDDLLKELKEYIDKTYSGHYGKKLQANEVIIARGNGIGFFLGNIDKYNDRYGKKGNVDDHRKDLFKMLHYALLAVYAHDREAKASSSKRDAAISELRPYRNDDYGYTAQVLTEAKQAHRDYIDSLPDSRDVMFKLNGEIVKGFVK